MPSAGKLFVTGTPIGNAEDITLRALRVLGEVDLVAAEDTRRTRLLLSRYEISRPLVSYHEFNEAKRSAELLEKLRAGRSVALVSDAGMPMISDPGRRLVHAALAAGIPIEVIPGVSAITVALTNSGLGGGPFFFHGFLPHKPGHRRKVLSGLTTLSCSLVFFESPYRLHKSLQDMHDLLGNRLAVVTRELTKKFEEVLRGDLSALLKKLENRQIKGEITIVVEGSRE